MNGVSFQSFSGNRCIIIPLLVPLPNEKIQFIKIKNLNCSGVSYKLVVNLIVTKYI
jgi:hypothetical protein